MRKLKCQELPWMVMGLCKEWWGVTTVKTSFPSVSRAHLRLRSSAQRKLTVGTWELPTAALSRWIPEESRVVNSWIKEQEPTGCDLPPHSLFLPHTPTSRPGLLPPLLSAVSNAASSPAALCSFLGFSGQMFCLLMSLSCSMVMILLGDPTKRKESTISIFSHLLKFQEEPLPFLTLFLSSILDTKLWAQAQGLLLSGQVAFRNRSGKGISQTNDTTSRPQSRFGGHCPLCLM